MRVLFCKISSMKYYKGHCKDDIPMYGGAYVEENGYGHEEYNFMPVVLDEKDYSECVGFVEPKSNKGTRNSLHIEKIEGCAAMKKEPFIEDVLVIWCATRNLGDKTDITVVGWYKHATVFRDLTDWTMAWDDGTEEERYYNVIAKAADCVLLPEGIRNQFKWNVPTAKYTKVYGFGQSMVWYPTEPKAKVYLNRLIENIENYRDENWLTKYPEK